METVRSDAFRQALESLVPQAGESEALRASWADVDASTTQAALIKALDGLRGATFDGTRGEGTAVPYRAYAGTRDGAVVINQSRFPESAEAYAQTLVHEAAHRIGLMHPSSETDPSLARCEPPYAIGRIVLALAQQPEALVTLDCP